MRSINRDELDAVSNHISNLPTVGALYAPVLVEHCRALLAEVERLKAEEAALPADHEADAMTNAELLDLLREARKAFGAIETVAADSYECDCPPDAPRCGACRIQQHARSAQRRIAAALAEHDAVPSSKESDEIRAIWRAYANRELSEDEAKAKLAELQEKTE